MIDGTNLNNLIGHQKNSSHLGTSLWDYYNILVPVSWRELLKTIQSSVSNFQSHWSHRFFFKPRHMLILQILYMFVHIFYTNTTLVCMQTGLKIEGETSYTGVFSQVWVD
jgi:hypothetical protein